MKIMAPVNSYQSALMQIKAGADEIYLGLNDGFFEKISFTGRGKVSNSGLLVNPNLLDFRKIVDLCHRNSVEVDFTANIQILLNDANSLFIEKYLEYVQKGIDSGIDRIIVGDVGNILLLRKQKVNIPIVASTFLSIFNAETVNFMKSLGAERVVLPHQITLEEIVAIKSETDIELETFVGVGCSNIEGSCHMIHNCGEDIRLSLPCKALYKKRSTGEESSYLDVSLDCALCNIGDLITTGVDVIKIVGRDQNPLFTASITRIHKEVIGIYEKKETFDKVEAIINAVPWWKKEFCLKKRCKFKNNPILNSYV